MISGERWNIDYQKEMARAHTARAEGNEGMARVCARRAAAIIVAEYLLRRGYTSFSTSLYDRLAIFNSLTGVNPQCKEIASHFLLKVDPDHNLPIQADLLSEVEWLADDLLLSSE